MDIAFIFATFYRRFFLASAVWLVAWPVLMFIKLGQISGPKAWFWIIGELNYPVAAVAYILLDGLLRQLGLKSWMVFTGASLIIAVCMPFYYERIGFALGVTLEARFL